MELGSAIRRTRLASGITQAQLARIAGVSRATLNYAEQGRSAVGADALLRILPPLGLAIGPRAVDSPGSKQAIDLLATSASVSYKDTVPVAEVERALVEGTVEDRWVPHIATMIDEASDSLLLQAVRDVSVRRSQSASQIWRHLQNLARTLASPHPRWM